MIHKLDDVLAWLKKLDREEFYGTVNIKFHQGRISYVDYKAVLSRKNGENPDKKPK